MNERLLAIIPAYNEAANIAAVVSRAKPYAEQVVVVDDGSSDGTGAVALKAGAKVLRHEQNRGKGAAIETALEYFAGTDMPMAIFLDADGQHAPEEIPKFVAKARETGAGIVVGNRMGHTAEMPPLRRAANRITSWLTGKLAHQPVPDSQCGFRLLRREVLPFLSLKSSHFETETEMLIQAGRAGCKIANVDIRTIYEPGRASRIRPWRDTVRFFRLVLKYL